MRIVTIVLSRPVPACDPKHCMAGTQMCVARTAVRAGYAVRSRLADAAGPGSRRSQCAVTPNYSPNSLRALPTRIFVFSSSVRSSFSKASIVLASEICG